jgi:hypothetical protein
MRYWEFITKAEKTGQQIPTNTYIERIFECFDIGEEFTQRVLLR